MTTTSELALQVLKVFGDSEAEAWDLHSFLELVAGDDRNRREAVFDVVDRLAASGYMESRSSDFYTITAKGREAARSGRVEL